ncbi:MAG: alpha/beta hydrolase fold domain-containing protein [Oscillospiraceae bacterium]
MEDSFSAYQFLLEQEGPVVLCGESAGGGMIYALCFLAKEKGLAPASGPHWHFALDGSSPPQAAHTKRIGSGTPP